jgi:hypothetical protein
MSVQHFRFINHLSVKLSSYRENLAELVLIARAFDKNINNLTLLRTVRAFFARALALFVARSDCL